MKRYMTTNIGMELVLSRRPLIFATSFVCVFSRHSQPNPLIVHLFTAANQLSLHPAKM